MDFINVGFVFDHLQQQLVVVHCNEENVLAHSPLQTWRNGVHKFLHLLLLGLVLIHTHQVFSDVILNFVRDFQTVHGSVSIVQTLLELDVLFVHFLDEHSHLTENVGVCHSGDNHHYHNNNHFVVSDRCNFIDTEDHDSVVTH